MIQTFDRYRELKIFLITFLFAVIVARSLYPLNFLHIAAWGSIAIILMVLLSSTSAIILLFLIVFTGDQFSGLGLVPQIFPDLLLTPLIITLLLKALLLRIIKKEKIEAFGALPIFCFFLVCVLSSLYNETGMLSTIVFLRSVFQFYLFFVALQNLDLNEQTIKRINIFLFVMFIIQIPTAVFKWLHFGVYKWGTSFGSESVGGTYGVSHGTVATLLPLFAIGFLLPMYIWSKKKPYLFLIFGFIFFSFLGGKRAFPIVLPIFIFSLFYFMRVRINFSNLMKYFFIGILIGAIGIIGGAKLHPSMNPSHKIGGEFDTKFLIDKISTYSTRTTDQGHSEGRFSTTKQIVSKMSEKGAYTMLLGIGPGTMIKSGLVQRTYYNKLADEFNVSYGVTGFIWIFIQLGILGVLCYLMFLWKLFKKVIRIYRSVSDKYWLSFAVGVIGAVLVFMFDFVAYSRSFIGEKVLSSMFYYVIAALLNVPLWGKNISEFSGKDLLKKGG